MDTIQLKPDEHLEVILRDPTSIVSKERALSESTYPLLAAYYQWIRKINGIHTKLDTIIDNEQILGEFIFLCEHNLLFFLTVTGRFDVIKELFLPHKLTARERYLIHLIQREHAQAHRQQDISSIKAPKQVSEKETPHHLDDWKKYANGLSNMDFYYYYTQEIKRISCEYNLKQIQVLSQAYNARQTRLLQAIDIMRSDDTISEEVKLEAERLYKKYSEIISDFPDYNSIGINPQNLSLHVIEQDYHRMRKHYDDSEEIHDFLEKNSRDNARLKVLLREERRQSKSTKEQLKANEKEYKEEIKVLTSHLKKVSEAALGDIDKNLHHIIHFINKCPQNNLNSEQQKALKESVNQLKEYRDKFKKTKNFDETQDLLKECSGKLQIIKDILKPNLPQNALKVLVKEIQLFNEGIIERREPLPEEQLVSEEQLMLDLPSAPVIQEKIDSETQSASSETEDSNKDGLESQFKESAVAIEQALHNITLFKSELQIIRGENELIELSEEEQQSYKIEINKLLKDVQLSKENDSIAPDDLPKIEKTEELIKKVKTIGFDRVNINLLKSLYDQVDSLSNQYERLEKSKDKLSDLIDNLTDNLQKNVQI